MLWRSLLVLLCGALLTGLVMTGAVQASAALIDPKVPATSVDDMFSKINALRAARGRAPLTWNAALAAAAQEQADYISRTGNYAHVRAGSSPGSRALAAGYQTNVWCCSENTHRTQVGKSAWEFWNYSRPHYYNMISSQWTEIGIASSNVSVWTGYVMVFGGGIQAVTDTPPAVPPASTTATTISAPAGGTGTHRVAWGETLGRIAARYGVSLAQLRAANGLTGDLIFAGQTLVIPGADGVIVTSSGLPGGTRAEGQTVARITSPVNGAALPGGFAITGSALLDPVQAQAYKVEITGGQFGLAWITVGSMRSVSVADGVLEYLHPVAPGTYVLRVVLIGPDGGNLLASPGVVVTVR